MRFSAIFYIALSLLTACSKETDHHKDEEGGHPHEGHNSSDLPTISQNIFTDKSEMFVEFTPLIKGKKSSFGAHFNDVVNFKPFLEGRLKVLLSNGSIVAEGYVNKPAVAGIFRPELTPPVEGCFSLIFILETGSIIDTLTIPDVEVFANEAIAKKRVSEKNNPEEISYFKEQAWKTEFATKLVQPEIFSDIIRTSGEIISPPGEETIIAASASGILTFAGKAPTPGSSISKGASLFSISGENQAELNLDSRVSQLRAEYDRAKADYNRALELLKDKIIPDKEFQEIKARFLMTESNYRSLTVDYGKNGLSVKSKSGGYLKSLLVSDGQYVTSGQPLAIISKSNKVMLRADLSQKDYDKANSIHSAIIVFPQTNRAYDLDQLNGKVVSKGRSLGASYYVPIYFQFDNRINLIPGTFVEVFLKSGIQTDAVVLPQTAILEEQGKYYVYIQSGGESFIKRAISLGASDGMNYRVLSGLTPGERVVIRGAMQIKLATQSGSMPTHGHVH